MTASMDWQKLIADAENALHDHAEDIQPQASTLGSNALARKFDHTLLKREATADQIRNLCQEAAMYDFATVCVREPFAKHATKALEGADVKLCCVVGFHDPTASTLKQKLAEAQQAVNAGATELDMVIDWPSLKREEHEKVYRQLRSMRDAFPKPQVILKVIFETSQLSQHEIVAACVLASYADFDFVKTSTGFLGSGAQVEDVRLMYQMCKLQGKGMAVKASGGIRTPDDARKMVEAGASRLGASASVAIVLAAHDSTRS